jgi:class 3 adenylate cyclase
MFAVVVRLSARERAQLADKSFAYIDASGQRRLPIHDAAHVRAAIARFSQVRFDSDEARDRARVRILNAAKKFGIMPVGFITSQLRTTGSAPRLPIGPVTFLLTDIEGSTALLRELDGDYAVLLREVRGVIGEAVRANRGLKVDAHGDEFLAVFRSPAAALLAAVDMQRALATRVWPLGASVRVRAGIHSGRPTLTESGYVGISVHTVARICSVTHGGQVVVSEQTRAMIEAMPDGLGLVALGPHRLVGLPGEEELFQLAADGLVETFPPLRMLS